MTRAELLAEQGKGQLRIAIGRLLIPLPNYQVRSVEADPFLKGIHMLPREGDLRRLESEGVPP